MIKKRVTVLGSVIMTLLISSVAFAGSARNDDDHYSAGFSKSNGYSYADTYVKGDPSADANVGIHSRSSGGKIVGTERRGNGSINIQCASTNTYCNYYIHGAYQTLQGSFRN